MDLHQFSDADLESNGNDGQNETTKKVILFTAEWHEACVPGGSMDQLLMALAETSKTANTYTGSSASDSGTGSIQFGRCDAEANPMWTEQCGVTAVPTFCMIHGTAITDRIVGGDNAAAVTLAVQRLAAAAASSNGTKASSVGNEESTPSPPLSHRLDGLIRSSPVMIFMKGIPTAPKCGFSRQIVQLLRDEQLAFGSFDILTDETVRQGLKTHSNWPTYPQVYVNGELIGGLDILQEMQSDGGSLAKQWGLSMIPTIAASKETTTHSTSADASLSLNERLKQLINRSPVMLFMKGLPSAPQCGFSRQIVQLLDEQKIPFEAFDILTQEEIRQGLKDFSNWPTYPQLYVHGELIGGLDIVREMSEDGTLAETLQKQ